MGFLSFFLFFFFSFFLSFIFSFFLSFFFSFFLSFFRSFFLSFFLSFFQVSRLSSKTSFLSKNNTHTIFSKFKKKKRIFFFLIKKKICLISLLIVCLKLYQSKFSRKDTSLELAKQLIVSSYSSTILFCFPPKKFFYNSLYEQYTYDFYLKYSNMFISYLRKILVHIIFL